LVERLVLGCFLWLVGRADCLSLEHPGLVSQLVTDLGDGRIGHHQTGCRSLCDRFGSLWESCPSLHPRPQASSRWNRRFVCPFSGSKKRRVLHSEHFGRVFSVEHSINLFLAVGCRRLHRPSQHRRSAQNLEAPERVHKAFLCFQLWASTPTHRGLTAALLFRTRAGRHDTRVAEVQDWVGFRIGVRVQLDATGHCKLSFPAPPQGYRARAAGGLGRALSTRLACPQRLIREQPPLSGLGNAAAWAN
jgi:hypothetical protein